jgi:hypothetical protein
VNLRYYGPILASVCPISACFVAESEQPGILEFESLPASYKERYERRLRIRSYT